MLAASLYRTHGYDENTPAQPETASAVV